MRAIKTLASFTTLAAGILAVSTGYVSSASGGNQLLITALGVILVVGSLACFYGTKIAFAASAIASGLLFLSVGLGWGGGFASLQLSTLAVALTDIVLSVLAFRSSSAISEQSNPMNLPVFG